MIEEVAFGFKLAGTVSNYVVLSARSSREA